MTRLSDSAMLQEIAQLFSERPDNQQQNAPDCPDCVPAFNQLPRFKWRKKPVAISLAINIGLIALLFLVGKSVSKELPHETITTLVPVKLIYIKPRPALKQQKPPDNQSARTIDPKPQFAPPPVVTRRKADTFSPPAPPTVEPPINAPAVRLAGILNAPPPPNPPRLEAPVGFSAARPSKGGGNMNGFGSSETSFPAAHGGSGGPGPSDSGTGTRFPGASAPPQGPEKLPPPQEPFVNAHILTLPQPKYPERAPRIDGSLRVRVTLKADGTVEINGVDQNLGGEFAEAASDAARRLTFVPAHQGSRKFDQSVVLEVDFQLAQETLVLVASK